MSGVRPGFRIEGRRRMAQSSARARFSGLRSWTWFVGRRRGRRLAGSIARRETGVLMDALSTRAPQGAASAMVWRTRRAIRMTRKWRRKPLKSLKMDSEMAIRDSLSPLRRMDDPTRRPLSPRPGGAYTALPGPRFPRASASTTSSRSRHRNALISKRR